VLRLEEGANTLLRATGGGVGLLAIARAP
jgi:hypothetical protein